jgi:hypothetical protein
MRKLGSLLALVMVLLIVVEKAGVACPPGCPRPPAAPVTLACGVVKIVPAVAGETQVDIQAVDQQIVVYYNDDVYTFAARKAKSVYLDASRTEEGAVVDFIQETRLPTAYRGGAAADNVVFGDGNSVYDGGSGDATVTLGGGNNLVCCGSGTSFVSGGSKTDLIFGGSGDLFLDLGSGHSLVFLGDDGMSFVSAARGGCGTIFVTAPENSFITLETGNYRVIEL